MADTVHPAKRPTSIGALIQLGCALMRGNDGAKAVRLVEALRAADPGDPALRSAERLILSENVPRWHAPMLADAPRNQAYARAIARAAPEARKVLDIGAGSSLLALMAARAGAQAVFACEANPALAETAREIVAANCHGEAVTVIAKRSTDVQPADIGGVADLIVTEIFADDLIGEGVLPTMRDALGRLAEPGAKIIPASASIRIALAWRDIEPTDLSDVEGFDLSLFERHVPTSHKLKVGDRKLQLRSEAETLFRFDFQSRDLPRHEAAQITLVATGGDANGVVQWMRLQLDAREVYETDPRAGASSGWAVSFHPVPAGGTVRDGETVVLNAAHDDEHLQLWFSE